MSQRRRTDELRQMPVHYGDFLTLRGKYAVLVTYKRDGTAVPTPVWFARRAQGVRLDRGQRDKALRLRSDSRALLAPCTARGVPTG